MDTVRKSFSIKNLFIYKERPVLTCFLNRSPTYFYIFGGQLSFCGATGTPVFEFLVTPLGFKARVGSALFALSGGICYTYPEIHFWCYTCWPLGSQQCSRSLPHMHQQRWNLAWIWMGDHPYRRRTRYHCASDPAPCIDLHFFNFGPL